MPDKDLSRSMFNEIPLFAGCSPETIDRIMSIAQKRDCARGEIIYEAGTDAVDMFVLVNGLVSFTTGSKVGHLYNENLMKRHMIFGWAALIPEHPRRLGTAKCIEDSKLLVINGDEILEVLKRDPQSGMLVMTRLCSMIASTFIETQPTNRA